MNLISIRIEKVKSGQTPEKALGTQGIKISTNHVLIEKANPLTFKKGPAKPPRMHAAKNLNGIALLSVKF